MKKNLLSLILAFTLIMSVFVVTPAFAQEEPPADLIPVDVSSRLKNLPAPKQLSPVEAAAVVAAGPTTGSQCFGNDDTLTITITSFDPANPGSQDVVFWRETAGDATGKATLWVAWDFLATQWGRQDVITCDQLEYLQSMMDSIVATDIEYFGQYVLRPAGNENIDVMIYNIVDEGYFDPEYPFYIAGFFWSSINEQFDRNMIFIDSYDWENRLGADVARPFLYEGTVAHELEHLIHNDMDSDELSWVDEGLADMAQYVNGFGHDDGHIVYYLAYHRTSLTLWGGGLEDYGASYLFQLYLLENFGEKDEVTEKWDPAWTRKLVAEPLNSIAGVEAATGASFNDLYDSWILANYIDNPDGTGPGDWPLGYYEIDLTPYVSPTYGPWSIQRAVTDIYGADHKGNLPISRYWGGYVSGTVEYPLGAIAPYAPVYGTFKGMQPNMAFQLRGDAKSGVAPYAGMYEVASGGGNMLTDRMLALSAPVGGTLTFQTWYDIEEEWDYGFVEASIDGGATWAPLAGSITRTSMNPNNSTAWANSLVGGMASTDTAITGNSGGWVEATFDLPAASDVMVRFAYYTDEATIGQGWFIDEVSVNGFSDGFEAGAGNWELGGWNVTTGLFDNDWLAAYVNPIYENGKFAGLTYGYFDDDLFTDKYELLTGLVDTSRLLSDSATVVFSNRPGDGVFDAGYRMLVNKLNNRK